jgi:hypothetical protein
MLAVAAAAVERGDCDEIEFLRSGGSAFCLTLRLDRRSVPLATFERDAAVA